MSARISTVMHALRGVWSVLALCCPLGCSGMASGGETCTTEGICDVTETDPAETRWACLDKQPPPIPNPTPNTPLAYGLPVVEWNFRTPLTGRGLTATPCGIIDPGCSMPAALPYTPEPGMLGGVPVPIPMPLAPIPLLEGFDGLLKFQVAEEGVPPDGPFIPLLYYLGGPMVGPGATLTNLAILMVRRNVLDRVIRESFERVGLDGSMETTVDRLQRGLVVLRAIDCLGAPAQDVYFTINREGVIPFQLPTTRLPLAAEPPYTEPVYTDELGAAGFANVLPGNVQVAAYRRGATQPFGRGGFGVVAGQISVTVIRPRYFNTASLTPPPSELETAQ